MEKTFDILIEELKARIDATNSRGLSSVINPLEYDEKLHELIELLNHGSNVWQEKLQKEKGNVSIYERITDSITWSMEFDAYGNVIYAKESRSMNKILGYSNDNPFTLADMLLHMDENERDVIEEKIQNAFANEPGYDIEYHLKKKDGSFLFVRTIASFTRREDGSIESVTGVNVDLNNDFRMKDFLDAVSVSKNKIIQEKENIIFALNKMFFAVYHYDIYTDVFTGISAPKEYSDIAHFGKLHDLMGVFVDTLVDEKSTKELFEFLNRSTVNERLKGKNFISVDYKEEHRGWCRGFLIPFAYDKNNIVSEVLFVIQVIDEQKRLEIEQAQKIKEAMLEATNANKTKSAFISRMSHDMRTPMNAIVGLTEIGKNKINDPLAMKDILEKISYASDHLLSLINDVLDVDKMTNGKIEVEKRSFSLRESMNNCKKIIRESVIEKQINFMLEESEIVKDSIIGSPIHFERAVLNVLNNAIRYNRIGGLVKVVVRQEIIDSKSCIIEVKVRDSGVGMSEEFLGRIYEPFSQVENEARSNYEGSGLGMTITKRLIDAMDGNIQINSALGRGTSIKIRVPFGIAEGKNKVSSISQDIDISGVRILLVEDNKLNAEIATELLEDAGAIVEKAENGKIAIDSYMAHNEYYFDCIIMDIRMPVLNGMEATKIIRSLSREDSKSIPIFALTADTFMEDVIKMKQIGMNEHFSKPLNIDKIKKYIFRYCKKESLF